MDASRRHCFGTHFLFARWDIPTFGTLRGTDFEGDKKAEKAYSPFSLSLSCQENMDQIRQLQRPTPVPDEGLLCDLLWSDPEPEIRGWADSDRGKATDSMNVYQWCTGSRIQN